MGILYLIQPAELVGTNRVKVGCSKRPDLSRVTKDYKKGTLPICICYVEDPIAMERIIVAIFKHRFRLLAGNEYFVGDINEMRKVFFEQISMHTSYNEKEDESKSFCLENYEVDDEIEDRRLIDTLSKYLKVSGIERIHMDNKKRRMGRLMLKDESREWLPINETEHLQGWLERWSPNWAIYDNNDDVVFTQHDYMKDRNLLHTERERTYLDYNYDRIVRDIVAIRYSRESMERVMTDDLI